MEAIFVDGTTLSSTQNVEFLGGHISRSKISKCVSVPVSYVLDSMTGVDRLYANEPEKVVALARAHLSMPAKDFRCIFSNFMAFAAWCRYYPDVRRNPTDPTKQYKCTRTGWRYGIA